MRHRVICVYVYRANNGNFYSVETVAVPVTVYGKLD